MTWRERRPNTTYRGRMGTRIRSAVAAAIRREISQTERALAVEVAQQGVPPASVWPSWWSIDSTAVELPWYPGTPEMGHTSRGDASPFLRHPER